MSGNLLGREVYGRRCGRGLRLSRHRDKTTAGVITVDGGNIEASLR